MGFAQYVASVWDSWLDSGTRGLVGTGCATAAFVLPTIGFSATGTNGWIVLLWAVLAVVVFGLMVSVVGGYERARKESVQTAACVEESDYLRRAAEDASDDASRWKRDLDLAKAEMNVSAKSLIHSDNSKISFAPGGRLLVTGMPQDLALVHAFNDSEVNLSETALGYAEAAPDPAIPHDGPQSKS